MRAGLRSCCARALRLYANVRGNRPSDPISSDPCAAPGAPRALVVMEAPLRAMSMEPSDGFAVNAARARAWGQDVETGRANPPQRHTSTRGGEAFEPPAHLHRTAACLIPGYNVRSAIAGGYSRHPARALPSALAVATKNESQVALPGCSPFAKACSSRDHPARARTYLSYATTLLKKHARSER
jgi:hypothetical protein